MKRANKILRLFADTIAKTPAAIGEKNNDMHNICKKAHDVQALLLEKNRKTCSNINIIDCINVC